MKAIVFDTFGGPEVLQVVDIPPPEPTGAEVRVAVHAAGVNLVDCKIRSGSMPFAEPW